MRDYKIGVCVERIENIMGKEENAGYQNTMYSPFPTMFLTRPLKSRLCFNSLPYNPDPKKEAFKKNIVGKGENAGNQHFLLFPQCFLFFQRQKSTFELHLFSRLQMVSVWSCPKFCRLVKS